MSRRGSNSGRGKFRAASPAKGGHGNSSSSKNNGSSNSNDASSSDH
jgi:hypothetical protein